MASVHVGPDDKQIVMRGSETILAASLREGIPHAYACGGRARCSICRISVEEGLEFCSPRSKGERIVAERLNFSPATRLACQTKITGDVNVRLLVVDDDDIEFTRGIAEGPCPASIGEEKKLAILFADVRDFTALSERMSPYDVIYFLNRYFHLTSKVIGSNGGYVDNYMGDGLMALFGHDDAPDAAFRAVSAAIDNAGRGRETIKALRRTVRSQRAHRRRYPPWQRRGRHDRCGRPPAHDSHRPCRKLCQPNRVSEQKVRHRTSDLK